MDAELLKNQISGLETKLKTLRESSDLHHKAKGLAEEEERARADMGRLETKNQAVKEEIAELRAQKTEALRATVAALALKMAEVLPAGTASFEIGDEGVFIGWELPDRGKVPYASLSGGQKAIFDKALEYALMGPGEKVLIVEGAELDGENLVEAMKRLSALPDDTQVLLLTCHNYKPSKEVLEQWRVVEVAE